MADTEATPDDDLAARHREAQTAAFEWAQRAEAEQQNAAGRDDYAREHAGTPYAHLRDAASDARKEAQFHSGRSVDASRLAETWAHVALALAPLQAPANGQPATYDIQLFGAPSGAAAIDDALRRLEQRGPGEPSP